MADNWWESASSSSRNRIERGRSPSSSAAALNSSTTINMASFGWATDIVDIKATRSCLDSVSSVSGNSSVNNLFQVNTHKLGQLLSDHDHSTTTTTTTTGGGGGGGGGMLASSDPSLQMMGLGLSSQVSLDWNQSLFRGDQNRESNFRSMIQEDHMSSTSSFQQESSMSSSQDQWRSQKIYTGNSEDNSAINRGLSLDQNSSIITCQGLPTSFQMDSYGTLMGSENLPQQQQPSLSNYPSSYGSVNVSTDQISCSSWSKYPPFLRNSPPQVQPPNNQLHFSNNAPFWNAPAAAAPSMNDVRSNLFPSLQMQLPLSNFDEKPPKNTTEVVKKSSSESSNKRPRNDNPSPLPAFKVRKEKMGDRITALQQLVSPFGKTDTASVLSEAIEYIKFLHEQVGVLSTPYMKNGAPVIQHQQVANKSSEGGKQDLRSRGLCLVPVSSTFPVTHETTVDFWTPTFGGTFR